MTRARQRREKHFRENAKTCDANEVSRMNISLRQIRAFVAVAQFGGFTAAAERLHLTQSALSAGAQSGTEFAHACSTEPRVVQLDDAVRIFPVAEKCWATGSAP
jgi:hypothetical protein